MKLLLLYIIGIVKPTISKFIFANGLSKKCNVATSLFISCMHICRKKFGFGLKKNGAGNGLLVESQLVILAK